MSNSDKNIDIALLFPRKEMRECLSSLPFPAKSILSVFQTAGRFINSLSGKIPDLLILDMNLPDITGNDLLLILKNNPGMAKMLIVAVSDNIELSQKVKSFESGADDYFTYPVDKNLFAVRIKNLLERRFLKIENSAIIIKFDGLEICADSMTASYLSKEIKLTSLEFNMLLYFMKNKNRVVSRLSLISNVWNRDFNVSVRAVDKRIEILRSKLGFFARHIETVFGMGYIFK
ncbi:MAG: response regulator transcription factor [Elusimicrobia bacterium]|nr:response regulator transcription factor [Elusimicrobiota bacterium]